MLVLLYVLKNNPPMKIGSWIDETHSVPGAMKAV